MNIFSRAFCRVFQKCFHLAIPLLPYRTPKILESVKDVPSQFKKLGVKNVFIVTDEFIGKSHGMSLLRQALEQQGVNYIIYDIRLNYKYLGFWNKGVMEGKGELYFKNGDLYIGHFKKGKFFGNGVLYTKGNEVYKGNFYYGKFNGLGVYYYRDGSCKYGEWSNGTLVKKSVF